MTTTTGRRPTTARSRGASAPSTRRATASKPDKAAELAAIADELRAVLARYSPPFEPRTDAKGGYHLWSVRPLVIEGRQRDEVFFAGMIPQKGYVGFYYMPVYTNPERKKLFPKELLALLKGKSCFYIKKRDRTTMAQVRQALRDGLKLYKQRGWV